MSSKLGPGLFMYHCRRNHYLVNLEKHCETYFYLFKIMPGMKSLRTVLLIRNEYHDNLNM